MNEEQIREIAEQVFQDKINLSQFAVSSIPFHLHNGSDSSRVDFDNLVNKKMVIAYTIPGTNAATAANYSLFFTAPFPVTINQITEVHAVKGTDGSAVSLNIEKLIGTTAPGSGINLTTAAFDLKGNINTVVTGVLSTTVGAVQLATGDRLALKLTGTPTSVANVTVTIILNF